MINKNYTHAFLLSLSLLIVHPVVNQSYNSVWSNGKIDSKRILNDILLEKYVHTFNEHDDEIYVQHISNDNSYSFLKENIPFFECPDKKIERTYYFRWWVYRKHIKETSNGFIITEFMPNVSWAAKENAITCPGLFQFLDGRWMKNPNYLTDYANFWLFDSAYHENEKWSHFKAVLGHGFPLSDAILQFHKVHPSVSLLEKSKGELITNYEALKELRKTDIGLYWSNAGGWEGDGMEVAVGGNGIRPTINSYIYSQAKALSEISLLLGDEIGYNTYKNEAENIAELMLKHLWDEKASFFKVMKIKNSLPYPLVDVRELFGYIPWIYSIPPKGEGYEAAWSQINDAKGFYAPYGPTTCEQRHKGFKISYEGHDCQWNGPSWPYATSQTLMAMANVLQDYPQDVISKSDYLNHFLIYTNSQTLQKENGEIVPWIDENLNPYTGDWIARTMLKSKGNDDYYERGKDYNHSTYVDLLITGLLGFKPRLDNVIEINPCIPDNAWPYFCIEGIPYKNGLLTIVWDKKGDRYNVGSGLTVIYNGKVIGKSNGLSKLILKI